MVHEAKKGWREEAVREINPRRRKWNGNKIWAGKVLRQRKTHY